MLNITKALKERENKTKLGVVIGTIVEVSNNDETEEYKAKISIADGQILISKFFSSIKRFSEEDIAKKVIVMTGEDNQTFFVCGYAYEFEV